MRYFRTLPARAQPHRAKIALRALALLALPLILLLGLGIGRAQLPAPNPLVVPPLPPSPPAQLPAPVTTAVAPMVLPIPALPSPYSTPGPRTFNCSCSGPSTPTHWMGQVTSADYSIAPNRAQAAPAFPTVKASPRPSAPRAESARPTVSARCREPRKMPARRITSVLLGWPRARDLRARSDRCRRPRNRSERQTPLAPHKAR